MRAYLSTAAESSSRVERESREREKHDGGTYKKSAALLCSLLLSLSLLLLLLAEQQHDACFTCIGRMKD